MLVGLGNVAYSLVLIEKILKAITEKHPSPIIPLTTLVIISMLLSFFAYAMLLLTTYKLIALHNMLANLGLSP